MAFVYQSSALGSVIDTETGVTIEPSRETHDQMPKDSVAFTYMGRGLDFDFFVTFTAATRTASVGGKAEERRVNIAASVSERELRMGVDRTVFDAVKADIKQGIQELQTKGGKDLPWIQDFRFKFT
jgi:hypothetical protein